jgi:purine-binding chemotaxis protein CheW
VLQERAQALARKPTDREGRHGDVLTLITFELGSERFGVDIRHLLEIQKADMVTPVPGVPPFVLGVISQRGNVLTVISPGVLLGRPCDGWTSDGRILIVHAAGQTVGLLVDNVTGVLDLSRNSLKPPLAHGWSDWHRHITHLTSDLVHVLDADGLMADPDLIVR